MQAITTHLEAMDALLVKLAFHPIFHPPPPASDVVDLVHIKIVFKSLVFKMPHVSVFFHFSPLWILYDMPLKSIRPV